MSWLRAMLVHNLLGWIVVRCGVTDQPLEYRVANSDDATGILAVLQEVASEVPVSLHSPERQETIQSIIAECCSSGESWVAVDKDGTVVGFVLAKPDRLERFLHENQAVSLRYIGVGRKWRQRGIFFRPLGRSESQRCAADYQRTSHQSFCHVRSSCEHWIYQSGS